MPKRSSLKAISAKMPLCSSFSNARARWLMACFCCGSISREGLVHAVGDEDGIIAEAVIAARRKGEMPMHFAFESFASRPDGMRQRQARRRIWPRQIVGALFPQFVFDARHGDAEILGRSRPARRIDARRAVQRIDPKPGIIGQRGMTAGVGGGARLHLGIGGKGRAGFFRLGQAQFARADRLDAVRARAAP